MLAEGRTNVRQLNVEFKEFGYKGSYGTMRDAAASAIPGRLGLVACQLDRTPPPSAPSPTSLRACLRTSLTD